jgi:hypothetical protein
MQQSAGEPQSFARALLLPAVGTESPGYEHVVRGAIGLMVLVAWLLIARG